jgi:hypothetical protein
MLKSKKTRALPAAFSVSSGRSKSKKNSKSWGFLAGTVTALSFLGTVAALLGYGASLVLNTKFGMPHEPLFSSSFELIELIVAVLPQVFIGFAKLDFWRQLYLPMLWDFWPPMMGLTFGWTVFAILWLNRARITKLKHSGKLPRLSAVAINLETETWRGWAWKGALYGMLLWVGTPLVLLFGIMSVITVIFMLTMIPLLGMASANVYLEEYVVKPSDCAPLWSRETRLANAAAASKQGAEQKVRTNPKASAQCVAVQLPRSDAVTGRVVLSTSSAIYLFDPATGVTRRLPVKDAVITAVDKV